MVSNAEMKQLRRDEWKEEKECRKGKEEAGG